MSSTKFIKLQAVIKFIHKMKKISMFSLVFLWLAYLVSINHAATQSFELDVLNQDIKTTGQEVLLLNVAATELQSVERIENDSKNLSLVQTEGIYYLTDTKEAVALR